MIYPLTLLPLIGATLLLTACKDSTAPVNNNATDLDHIYTYIEQTYQEPLQDPASCVNYTRSCHVEALPFIAMSYPETQIPQIMSRVVVSHDWMGERFEALLTHLPKEILTLLGSVTAIVIADNIRPSFYWTGSGAIYLDPASLWLTNEEKLTIDQTSDYRDELGANLSYDFFHRFVKQGQAAYRTYSLSNSEERTLDDIIIPMASLLFHELAHANDFMPASLMVSLHLDQTTRSEIARFSVLRLNQQLKQRYPIVDSTLISQAKILYTGTTATEEETQHSASYLGDLMSQEGANHLYAYSHQAEDVAMLFQATMLNYYYGIEMDSAFVIKPQNDSNYCEDYIVGWGQRNRIADPMSKQRAQFVSEQLLTDLDLSPFFAQLTPPQTFPDLTNWCNISLSSTDESNSFSESTLTDNDSNSIKAKSSRQQVNSELLRHHHHGVITSFN
ncbi:hypothetical protein CW745_12870 [Psychromonas sp. psych-6C06]|uniref:hypothetical protein n=1 Tax=Psychromonas sp. psych-6C06 TaxID=2058089 RepID=UPI000C33C0A0|nr:hypothetical protein [Psychromonas sp. psych-6C06]PKF60762.1 hypothetical protein CW745_12870 [Psychromonas sp. psych-6C06]